MKRDCILLAVDSLPIGGTERQVVELLRGLKESGQFRVVLALLDRGGELEAEAAQAAASVLRLSRRMRFDCTPALFLLRQARQAGIRLIHACGWMSALAALPTARCLNVPIINGSIRAAPARLQGRDRISTWCAVRSDWIVANSHAGLAAHGLSDHPRAQVIANGIDFTRFDNVIAERQANPTICMVANFSARKDHASVIAALPCVRRAFPQAELLLVGTDRGTLDDNRRLAERLGLRDAIRFVTHSLRPESFIASSHVCVLASVHESLSNAILEYLALAKPVVATATCGDSAELIRNSECGFLVPPHSPESLAARIIALLRDPERAQRMGESGRRQVQMLTVPHMVSEYEALYVRLLASPPAAPRVGARRQE